MYRDEYQERVKPMLWALFASASTMRGNDSKAAGHSADAMLNEFEKRFPPKPEKDYEV